MITSIKEHVSQHFKISADTLSVSKFFHASDKANAKVLFLVTDGFKPICMVKIMRDATYTDQHVNEIEGQRYAREQLSDYLIPEVYFTTTIGGHFASAEAVLSGIPVGRKRAPSYISAVHTFQLGQPKQQEIEVASVVASLKALNLQDEKFNSLCKQLEEVGGVVYRSWAHGDLTYMNVMDIGGTLAIIDWERYGQRPIWGIDFVHYFVRAVDVKDVTTFKAMMAEYLILSKVEGEYFERVYLLDEIMDIIHKRYVDRLKEVQFT